MNIKERMAFIIQKEAEAINQINITDEFETAIQLLLACPGKVITTGIGKAGYVASKFSATLSSTGTPAFFVHPAEAGHGDLGMVNPDDVIIAFSTSGKSIEVIEMLENARQLGVSRVIGVTSHPDSPLRKLSELVLDMGSDIVEPCPLQVTPSASIAVMQAISDALALTLMELKGFTTHDYGMRHHKGYLGSITRQQHQYDD
ncbi:SIS domain-containing protein [Pseudomonadales bacterium]|nr:SIS domain-containing protein [Pseudomonadales bacterium]MDA9315861.1 SIS domain-containing protein [Pseudomonadales bacterium]MDB9867837.1 SIS domain-containing protein [Pseudomonadales bacterium]MDB9917988.1 SIS domain-containing protein [Pseudomonadales bacterium]MDB9942579.1 SIS domain-containing protein [Pseudomonadales bacterium]